MGSFLFNLDYAYDDRQTAPPTKSPTVLGPDGFAAGKNIWNVVSPMHRPMNDAVVICFLHALKKKKNSQGSIGTALCYALKLFPYVG